MSTWSQLSEELRRWSEDGRRAGLWWRDDDAKKNGPKLARLISLAETSRVPLAVAVIPGQVQDDLGLAFAGVPELSVLVHGLGHENFSPSGEKKSEFGPYRPVAEMLGDIAVAFETLMVRFPTRTHPVFVPPWNRIDPELVACLPMVRFRGLSQFGPRAAKNPVEGLIEVNCHMDLIDWRENKGFVGEELALSALISHLRSRRTGSVDAGEATGILSHHDVMDDKSWQFLAELFDRTKGSEVAHWLTMNEIFNLPK